MVLETGTLIPGKSEKMIEQAIEYVNELFRNNAGGHDTEHTLRVYHNAMLIADAEPGCDREIVAIAALLHDADDHKLFRTENNENTRSFLKSLLPAERIEEICACIIPFHSAATGVMSRKRSREGSYRTRTGSTLWEPLA